jgi:ABC-type bacteriocin/lantibiotic exporter with double-glycine peptidase domain
MYAMGAALVLVLAVQVYATSLVRWETIRGRVGPDGVCLQTTGFTCAPAALATYLAGRGIEASEQELARLCRTTALGTSDRGMLSALAAKGLRPRIAVGDASLLERCPLPCLAMVAFASGIDHCVVLTGVGPDRVELVDPLVGAETRARAPFARGFKGVLIWAD